MNIRHTRTFLFLVGSSLLWMSMTRVSALSISRRFPFEHHSILSLQLSYGGLRSRNVSFISRKLCPIICSVPSAPKICKTKNQSSSLVRCAHSSSISNSDIQKEQSAEEHRIVDTSTFTLLEHVNINVPDHTYIVPFYFHLLGMGLDTRRAQNIPLGKGTLWANCGASQFHLPYGETAQVIPGRIGVRYHRLDGLKQRLLQYDRTPWESNTTKKDTDLTGNQRPFRDYRVLFDPNTQLERIEIVDVYGNVFLCQQDQQYGRQPLPSESSWIHTAQQPNVCQENTKHIQTFGAEVVSKFGLASTSTTETTEITYKHMGTECKGIQFLEFYVPHGTAHKIAEFYDCVFDATVSVVDDVHTIPPSHPTTSTKSEFTSPPPNATLQIAIVAFGHVDSNGKASQSLVFREISNHDPDRMHKLPPYDGHHIALYVGTNAADFEQAFQNCLDAGIIWVNPRFSDKALTLSGAKTCQQFRFKNILDLETGKVIFELEHEIRSIEHEAWPGRSNS